MLPFNAQGAVSAMEDGGALGYLFQHVDDPGVIPERLEIFQRARADRVARVQILSNVKLGKEKEVQVRHPYRQSPIVPILTRGRRPDKYG